MQAGIKATCRIKGNAFRPFTACQMGCPGQNIITDINTGAGRVWRKACIGAGSNGTGAKTASPNPRLASIRQLWSHIAMVKSSSCSSLLPSCSENSITSINRRNTLFILHTDKAFCITTAPKRKHYGGVWRSLVAHLVRDEGVAGSNPATPTIIETAIVAKGSAKALSVTDICSIDANNRQKPPFRPIQ